MKVRIADKKTEIKYEVEDVPVKYHEALKHYFFQQDGDVFTKVYCKDQFMFSHNINNMEHRFSIHLIDMLQVTTGHKVMDWELVFENVVQIMEKFKINWWLAGSTACAVRGIKITPQDIDIMTYKSEISKIEKAFGKYIVEPFHYVGDWEVKGFGVVFLNGRIDFAFEPEETSDANGKFDYGFYASHNLEAVLWKGYQVKVPPVELHIPSNEIRGRTERITKIKEYIENKE